MLTRVEEVNTRYNEGIDSGENDVSLVSNGLECNRSNHDDHAEEELARTHHSTTRAKLTS